MSKHRQSNTIEFLVASERNGENAVIESRARDSSGTSRPKVTEVKPGLAVETIDGQVSAIRVYPVPANADVLKYETLPEEASQDMQKIIATVLTLAKRLGPDVAA